MHECCDFADIDLYFAYLSEFEVIALRTVCDVRSRHLCSIRCSTYLGFCIANQHYKATQNQQQQQIEIHIIERHTWRDVPDGHVTSSSVTPDSQFGRAHMT